MVITWSSACLFVIWPLLSVSAENLLDETIFWLEMFIWWSSACLHVTVFFKNSMCLLFCDPSGMLWKPFLFSINACIKQVSFFPWREWLLICSKSALIYWELFPGLVSDIGCVGFLKITVCSSKNDRIAVISAFKTLICFFVEFKTFAHGWVVVVGVA